MSSSTEKPPQSSAAEPERREFIKQCCAAAVGGVASAVPIAAGIYFTLDPIRNKSGQSQGGQFLFVTRTSALAEVGVPRKFAVISDKTDAWNRTPNVPVGAVYLRRMAGNKVEALNIICPHAGCAVDFRPESGSYLCPCHNSSFNLDGTLANKNSPSARPLDALEVEIRNQDEVWVRFMNFQAGTAEKIPVA